MEGGGGGGGNRGEAKSATHLVLEYEILSNCVENKKTREPSRGKTRLKFRVIGDNAEAGYGLKKKKGKEKKRL